jgi:hypothetical protein
MVFPLEPLHCQDQGNEEEDQVSPPRRTKLSPDFGAVDAHTPEQPGIPGALSHGVVFEVPLFASEPIAAM